MFAQPNVTTVLLIAVPVALALFLMLLAAHAEGHRRPPVAARLEAAARRRDRARQRTHPRRPQARPPAPATKPPPLEEAPERVEQKAHGQALVIPAAAVERRQPAAVVAPPVPRRDPEVEQLDRRQFLNRGLAGASGTGLALFGAASLAYLWPRAGGGFGGKVAAGTVDDAKSYFADKRAPLYVAEGRFYVVPVMVAPHNEDLASKVYPTTWEQAKATGVMVMYQKCAHLGCRVPWCDVSQWFECPCHGSQYNLMGERQAGPAPRGLSRFPFTVDPAGVIVADTGAPVDSPPNGTDTTGLPPPAEHCV